MPFTHKKVLLVQPTTTDSFWLLGRSVKRYLGAKTTIIPLPLLTLAAVLPREWELELIDMNIEELTDADICAADLVFVTGMIIHAKMIAEIILRCKGRGKKVVVGGPFATAAPLAPELDHADCLYCGEAEVEETFGQMIVDLERRDHRRLYRAAQFADIRQSPIPRFDLLKTKLEHYATMAVQISAGCLHACEFCNIPELKGCSRYKTSAQVVNELAAIYALGYRGSIFVVDDNFVARHREAAAIVAAILDWQLTHRRRGRFPFQFYTQADLSLGIGKGIVLASNMAEAGFYAVFLGIESPSSEAMEEASKFLNANHSAVEICRNIRRVGLMVYGGFIVGFDADGPGCFARMKKFIRDCGVYAAMAGMLTVLPGTKLEARLAKEGRLHPHAVTGDSFEIPNFDPKQMSVRELVAGYRDLFAWLYRPEEYFFRSAVSLREWTVTHTNPFRLKDLIAAFHSVVRQGFCSSYRYHYWRFLLRFLFTKKRGMAFFIAIMFAHWGEYANKVVVPRLDAELAKTA